MEEEYINFGDELILKSDFLKAINDAKAYSATQPWSAARRGAFDAVSELAANRGILSTRKYTNPETGESMYYATFGGDPFDINTYDKNTRRGWLDYVNFIGKLAESLPTKKSIDEKKKKEEEERIAKLPTFDNTAFINLLTGNISKGPLGGQKWNVNLWNTLDDVRDEKGAVGIDNRKTELIKLLRDIDKNFKAEDYNWKDSPFLDADDFKARLAKAIGALESKDLNDDTPALRELGLNYKDWFNNRTGETMLHPTTGEEVTYGNYYRGLQALKDAEAKAAAAQLKAQKDNLWKAFRSWDFSKFSGRPLTSEESNTTYLDNLFSKGKWTADENSQIVLAFKLAELNGLLVELSKEELAKLPSTWKNRGKYLRKINGLTSPFYYDTLSKQFKLFHNNDLNTKTSFLDVLNLNNPELLKKILQETPISKEGWTSADTADVVSIIGDLVSLGGFWANIGGTATSLTSDLYADISRDKDLGSILKGIGVNLGWGLAGMLPGAKSTRLVARAARAIPKAFMLAQSAGIVFDPEVQKSAMKFTSVDGLKTVSSKDLENLKYLFHAVTGGTNIAKSHFRAKNYREQINKLEVKTKDGTANLSNKDIKEINKVGRKEGLKAAEDLFKSKTKGLESIEGLFKFSEKSKFNPAKYSNTLNKLVGKDKLLKGKQVTDNSVIAKLRQLDKELPWYNWNKGYASFELPKVNQQTQINSELSVNKNKIRGYLEDLNKNKKESTTNNTTNKEPKINIPPGRSDERLNISRQLALPEHPTKGKNYEYVGKRSTQNNSIRENQKELNDFIDSYGLNSKRGNRSGGYDINRKLDNGVYSINKNGVTAVLDKKSDSDITITFGDLKQHFRNLASARRYLADAIYNLDIRKNDISKTAEVLRSLKLQGVFKHGGTLTLDKTIENFLKNNNI